MEDEADRYRATDDPAEGLRSWAPQATLFSHYIASHVALFLEGLGLAALELS